MHLTSGKLRNKELLFREVLIKVCPAHDPKRELNDTVRNSPKAGSHLHACHIPSSDNWSNGDLVKATYQSVVVLSPEASSVTCGN